MSSFRVALMLGLVMLSGCSSHAAYDAIQERNKVECMNLPEAEYEKCMARSGESYDRYEAERKALKQKPAN